MAVNEQKSQDMLKAATYPFLKAQKVELNGYPLLCNMSCGSTQPLVPMVDHVPVSKEVHGVAHPGVRATHQLLTTRFL
jgi:hypothetical protein